MLIVITSVPSQHLCYMFLRTCDCNTVIENDVVMPEISLFCIRKSCDTEYAGKSCDIVKYM